MKRIPTTQETIVRTEWNLKPMHMKWNNQQNEAPAYRKMKEKKSCQDYYLESIEIVKINTNKYWIKNWTNEWIWYQLQ